mgnify:CR=1 FL=1
MVNIYIKCPIWKSRSVGINHNMITDDLVIHILYTEKDGKRLYPNSYRISKEDALKYPIQHIGIDTKLHIIPISDLKIETEDEKAEREYMQTQGFYR